MSLAVRTEITRRIPGIIESADLEKCTVKILQRQLEEGLKRDLGEHTDFIRLTVRDDDDDDAMRGTMRGTMRGIVDARDERIVDAREGRGGDLESAGESDRACARAFHIHAALAFIRASVQTRAGETMRETRGLTERCRRDACRWSTSFETRTRETRGRRKSTPRRKEARRKDAARQRKL